jgi:SAM-dependent methyltransferase
MQGLGKPGRRNPGSVSTWLFAIGCLTLGCAGATRAPEPIEEERGGVVPPSTDPEDDGETSLVDPAINARYAEETNVEGWIGRFEREGREVHDHRDRIVAALGLEKGMRVADLGAGTGLFSFAMARAVGPNGRVFAVDVQPYFLEHLRQRAIEEDVDNLETIAADQRSPNLPPSSIDLAFFCDVYHHVEHPRAYLGELRRALEPEGRLVVIDYKRIEGKSPPWLLEHIRAAPEVFRAEIERAGFRFVREEEFLEENFFYVFEIDPSR